MEGWVEARDGKRNRQWRSRKWETAQGSDRRSRRIGVRMVGVRPVDASIDAPILASLPDQTCDLSEECLHMPKRPDDRTAKINADVENGQRGPHAALTEHDGDSGQRLPGQSVQSPKLTPGLGPTNLLLISASSDSPE
jgi:hypothetical protein